MKNVNYARIGCTISFGFSQEAGKCELFSIWGTFKWREVSYQACSLGTGLLEVGWRGKCFWLIRISVSQNLPESNKSSYWAGDVVKNTVKSWNSQMNFHSVEIFPRDVNCRKRHHSGSTLLHMRACAIGSQSPTSTTLSHCWLLGSKYEHEMGPKTKTNTYEFIEFSFFLTLSLPRNQSQWYQLGDWVFQS